MPKIIQFLHTAVEATPSNKNQTTIPWNNYEDHRRKFLISDGSYVEGSDKISEKLTFWGEWEAQSEIEYLKNTKDKLPTILNRPYIDPSVPNRTHNTDPYVFGSNFRYIVCKQGAYEILRNLDPLSLILFGSSINKQFCLDTVFIVSNDILKYTLDNIGHKFQQKNQYYFASVNPLYDDTKPNSAVDEEDSCRIEPSKEYSFYKGVNFEDKEIYGGIYSYVPCKVFNQSNEIDYIFKQPVIDLDILSSKQTQGINACGGKEFTETEIIDIWDVINEQISNAGLLKGVHFKTPPLKSTS